LTYDPSFVGSAGDWTTIWPDVSSMLWPVQKGVTPVGAVAANDLDP
jgi:hypothetical protein